MVLEGRGLASLQPFSPLLFLWLLEKPGTFVKNQKRPVNLYFFGWYIQRKTTTLKIIICKIKTTQKFFRGFGRQILDPTGGFSPTLCRLAFPHLLWMPHTSLTCFCRSRCSANRRIYTLPWNKYSTWKLMVGRWKFLLRWRIFSCKLLVLGSCLSFFLPGNDMTPKGYVSSCASQQWQMKVFRGTRSWSRWKKRFRKSSFMLNFHKKKRLLIQESSYFQVPNFGGNQISPSVSFYVRNSTMSARDAAIVEMWRWKFRKTLKNNILNAWMNDASILGRDIYDIHL